MPHRGRASSGCPFMGGASGRRSVSPILRVIAKARASGVARAILFEPLGSGNDRDGDASKPLPRPIPWRGFLFRGISLSRRR